MRVPPGLVAACVLLLLTMIPGGADGAAPPGLASPAPARPAVGSTKTDRNRNKIFDDLERSLSVAAATAEVSVLVSFSRTLSETEVSTLLSAAGQPAPKRRFTSVPGMAVTLPRSAVSKLAASPLVRHLELDGRVSASADTGSYWSGATGARTAFGVTGNLDGNPTGYSATDVVVAVLDTGIAESHPDLTGKVLAWNDLVNRRLAPYDDNGHGTHVAGILAGTGASNSQYTGIAPGVGLVVLKVLDSSGSGYDSDVITAIDWVIEHRVAYGIRVINLSLGGLGPADGTDLLSDAVNRAYQQGLIVVVAAGNEGPGVSTVGYPAVATGAIAVGAVADPGEGGIYLGSFSNRGPTLDGRRKPDLVAPGVRVTSVNQWGGYTTRTGTSMSTPFVAGAAALVLAANPGLTAQQVRSILTETARDRGQPGADNEYGFGEMDVYAAVARAAGGSGANPIAASYTAVAGDVAARGVDWYTLTGVNPSVPVAATLFNLSADPLSPRLSLALLNAAGQTVARAPSLYQSVYGSTQHKRQETISSPGLSGSLRLGVYSLDGPGSYALDISGATATLETPAALTSPTATPIGWASLLADSGERAPGEPMNGPWTPDFGWMLSTLDSHSPTHAWSESPYADSANASLSSRAIDLSGVGDPRLRFWARYDLEPNADYGRVEVSDDGGLTYQTIDQAGGAGNFTGVSPSWQQYSFSMAGHGGSQVRIRFRLTANGVDTGDGWWLDDVAVEGYPGAATPVPSATPTASVTPTVPPTNTPVSSPTATATSSPTATDTPSPTPPVATPTVTSTPSSTPMPSVTPSPSTTPTPTLVEQRIPLRQGWNWISFAVAPPDPAGGPSMAIPVAEALASLAGKYDYVLGETGTYSTAPPYPGANTLTILAPGRGYFIRMLEAADLVMSGVRMPVGSPILLARGWRWIGFLPETAQTPSIALASLASAYDYLLGETGTYAPPPAPQFLNTLQSMEPGKGYVLRMTVEGVLTCAP